MRPRESGHAAYDLDTRINVRAIFDKRDNLKDPVWQARVRVPNSTGYKRITTKTSDHREAERFALNYYEEPSRDICYSRFIFLS
jgi:hypothetical protein